MQTIDGRELLAGLQDKARLTGRDLFEVMEADGFFLTRTRRREIASDAVTLMIRILDRETAENVLRRHLSGRPGTAQDMYDAVMVWIGEYRDALEAGHVG